MATQNDFIQWENYYTPALKYLDIINAEEYPFHTKISKFIDVAKSHFESSSRGKKNQKDSQGEKHIMRQAADSFVTEHTAVSKRADQMSDNQAHLRPPAVRTKVLPPLLWMWQYLQ